MENKVSLNGFEVEFNKVGEEVAAYVNGGENASITGTADEVIANYLEDARNSCGEDELYEAVANAK